MLGLYALEAAMDELAYATGVDPVELRLRNYIADTDQNTNKTLTSKALRDCYTAGGGAVRLVEARRAPAFHDGGAASSSAGAWPPACGRP